MELKKLYFISIMVVLFLALLGKAQADRFVGNNDGTVTDTITGLMWQVDVNNIHGYWLEGESFTQNLIMAGYDDWRQPSIQEFGTLFDAIGNPSVFPTQLYPPFNDIMQYYWTSSPFTVFDTSNSTTFYDVINPHWIWPVREAGSPVPEPNSIYLLCVGIITLVGIRKKFFK